MSKRRVEIIQQYGYDFLWIDGYLWMWNIPSEVEIEQEMADQCYGRVLVAGYGLGVIQKMLVLNPKVHLILTVEKEIKVIEVCKKHYGRLWGKVVCADYYEFSPLVGEVNHKVDYDCVVGDIWEEIHPKFIDDYVRFKEHSLSFLEPDGKLISWGMDYYEYLLQKRRLEK